MELIINKSADLLKSIFEEVVAAAMCAANEKINLICHPWKDNWAEKNCLWMFYSKIRNRQICGYLEFQKLQTRTQTNWYWMWYMGLDLPFTAIDRSHKLDHHPDGRMRQRPIIMISERLRSAQCISAEFWKVQFLVFFGFIWIFKWM